MSPTAPFLAPERDERLVVGRPKASGTTYYVIPGGSTASQSTVAVAANTDNYSFWFATTTLLIDQMASEVTAGAGTNFRIGFYAADRDWQPIGPPLADSGNLNSSGTGIKTYTPGTPIYVPRGRYLSVLNCDGAATFRIIRSGYSAIESTLGATANFSRGTVARTLAAFPTPGTAWTTFAATTGGHEHFVVYRVSTP